MLGAIQFFQLLFEYARRLFMHEMYKKWDSKLPMDEKKITKQTTCQPNWLALNEMHSKEWLDDSVMSSLQFLNQVKQ